MIREIVFDKIILEEIKDLQRGLFYNKSQSSLLKEYQENANVLIKKE